MTPFAKRLKTLRLGKNLTRAEMAASLGVRKEEYERYEGGTASPSVEAVLKLAAILGISMDELTGHTPRDTQTNKQETVPIWKRKALGKRIEHTRHMRNMSMSTAAAALHIEMHEYNDIEQGMSYAQERPGIMEKIAALYGMAADYFSCETIEGYDLYDFQE